MNINWRLVISLLGFLLLGLFVWYFQFVVAWVFIAGIISLIGRPIAKKVSSLHIGKLKLGNAVGAAATLLAFYAVFGIALRLFLPVLYDEAEGISKINFEAFEASIEEPLMDIEALILKYKLIELKPDESFEEYVWEKVTAFLSNNQITELMSNAFSIMGNFLFALAAITFISFFFLKEPGLFKNIIISIVPTGYEERANNILSRTKTTLRSYAIALVGQITIIFTIVFTGLSLISLFGPGIVTIKMALLMAAFAGVINLIPYLGPILGYAFGLLMVLVTNLDIFGESDLFLLVGVVTLVYAIAQGIDNFFTQPILFSKSVQAHPLEIFLIIIISGNIAGIPGMILAVPVYSFIRIFLKEFFSEYKVVRRLTAKMD